MLYEETADEVRFIWFNIYFRSYLLIHKVDYVLDFINLKIIENRKNEIDLSIICCGMRDHNRGAVFTMPLA
jgi:hypothetical protein